MILGGRKLTLSGMQVDPVYGPPVGADVEGFERIGWPGEYPYTRGLYATEVLAGKARGHQFRDVSSSAPVLQAVKHEAEIRAFCHQIGQLPEEIGPAVLIDRNMLNIRQGEACFPQAIGNCLRRKANPMLHTAKPLLFRRSNKLAVADERSPDRWSLGR